MNSPKVTRSAVLPVAALGLLAGSASAGIQTFDVSLSYSTPSHLAGLMFGLNAGTTGEAMSDAARTAASGSIDLRVGIENGSLVAAEFLGGNWSTTAGLSATIIDGSDATLVNISPLSINLASDASQIDLEQIAGSEDFSFSYSASAGYSGTISTEENGIKTSLLDLSQISDPGSPIFDGFIAFDGSQITLSSKLRFSGTGLDANLQSGKSFGYFGSSEIVAVGVVPAPASAMIGGLVIGFASRRRRG